MGKGVRRAVHGLRAVENTTMLRGDITSPILCEHEDKHQDGRLSNESREKDQRLVESSTSTPLHHATLHRVFRPLPEGRIFIDGSWVRDSKPHEGPSKRDCLGRY